MLPTRSLLSFPIQKRTPNLLHTPHDINKGFSGTILVEDWGSNRINSFLIKDGKQYRFTGPRTGPTAETLEGCYTIHWFICDNINGHPENCEFWFSEISSGCYEGLEPCGESCATEYYEYEVDVIKNANYAWMVQDVSSAFGGGWIEEHELLVAKFNTNHPNRNRFLGQSYNSGTIHLFGNSWGQNGTISWATYTNTGQVTSNTQLLLSSTGRITFPNTAQYEYSGSKSVALSDCNRQ